MTKCNSKIFTILILLPKIICGTNRAEAGSLRSIISRFPKPHELHYQGYAQNGLAIRGTQLYQLDNLIDRLLHSQYLNYLRAIYVVLYYARIQEPDPYVGYIIMQHLSKRFPVINHFLSLPVKALWSTPTSYKNLLGLPHSSSNTWLFVNGNFYDYSLTISKFFSAKLLKLNMTHIKKYSNFYLKEYEVYWDPREDVHRDSISIIYGDAFALIICHNQHQLYVNGIIAREAQGARYNGCFYKYFYRDGQRRKAYILQKIFLLLLSLYDVTAIKLKYSLSCASVPDLLKIPQEALEYLGVSEIASIINK